MRKYKSTRKGKVRIIQEGKQPVRLYTEVKQLKADANWHERVEFREGDWGPFAVLVESRYEDLDV